MSELVAHLVEQVEHTWYVELPSQPGVTVRAFDRQQAIDRYCAACGIIRRETHEGVMQQYLVHQLEPARGE
jgi:hypothetical protein